MGQAQAQQLQQMALQEAAKLAQQQKQQQQQQQQQQAQAREAPPVRKIVGDTIHVANLAPDVSSDDLKVHQPTHSLTHTTSQQLLLHSACIAAVPQATEMWKRRTLMIHKLTNDSDAAWR